jgi:hypothetical protein
MDYHFVFATGGSIPRGANPNRNEANDDPLWVARSPGATDPYFFHGGIHPGKVRPGFGSAAYSIWWERRGGARLRGSYGSGHLGLQGRFHTERLSADVKQMGIRSSWGALTLTVVSIQRDSFRFWSRLHWFWRQRSAGKRL